MDGVIRSSPGNSSFTASSLSHRDINKSQQHHQTTTNNRSIEDFMRLSSRTATCSNTVLFTPRSLVRTLSQRIKSQVVGVSLSEPLKECNFNHRVVSTVANQCEAKCGQCRLCLAALQHEHEQRHHHPHVSSSSSTRLTDTKLQPQHPTAAALNDLQRSGSVRKCMDAISNISNRFQFPKFLAEQPTSFGEASYIHMHILYVYIIYIIIAHFHLSFSSILQFVTKSKIVLFGSKMSIF
jgi:hypothetical protein